ncbi:PFK5A [Auxenochlorella protothecoides x Auxenochlorella symbiontica]
MRLLCGPHAALIPPSRPLWGLLSKSGTPPAQVACRAGPGTQSLPGPSDVLECNTLRPHLRSRHSPFNESSHFSGRFVSDEDRVMLNAIYFSSSSPSADRVRCSAPVAGLGEKAGLVVPPTSSGGEAEAEDVCIPLPTWGMRAGPRETIYFEPSLTRAAIVTVGGLCPGLNDVIQGLVRKLRDYGVPEGSTFGIRYGFQGFYSKKHRPVVLTGRSVEDIHLEGGSILGTSSIAPDYRKIVRMIDLMGLDMLFVIGGAGGHMGATQLEALLTQHGVRCVVVGVPKSIDNSILLVDRCFGFETAVNEAQRALFAAKVEALSTWHGIAVVKLMGHASGFIALEASMASGIVDACLIPEIRFLLDGEAGLSTYLDRLLQRQGSAVVCVAEGAGQHFFDTPHRDRAADRDVGPWLAAALKERHPGAYVKYIDPSYLVRSVPTVSSDRTYCKVLAHNAVHAAFAGFTGTTVGLVNTHYVLLPIPFVTQAPRRVDPQGNQWNRLRAANGQPNFT